MRKEWYICKMCWVDIKKFYELKCHLLNREKDVTDYENVEDSETEMYSSDNNLPLNGTEVTTNKFAEVDISAIRFFNNSKNSYFLLGVHRRQC